MNCPKCESSKIVKYGKIFYGKQRYRCQECHRQFVENPRHQPISEATRELVDKLLLEKLSLAVIARATGVSKRWLQYYVNQKYYQAEKQVEVSKKKREAPNSIR